MRENIANQVGNWLILNREGTHITQKYNLIKKWAKNLNRYFSQKDVRKVNKHIKDAQYHYLLGK